MNGFDNKYQGPMRSEMGQEQDLGISDSVPRPKGMVDIYVQDGDGGFEHVHHDPNLIVDLARVTIVNLLDPATNNDDGVVETFKVGTGGHVSGDILTPVAPSVDDTSLEDDNPFSKLVPTIEQIENNDGLHTSLRYTVPLEKDEANGDGDVAYTEAGLFCRDGDMFARETFPAIVKNSNRRVVFEWTLRF